MEASQTPQDDSGQEQAAPAQQDAQQDAEPTPAPSPFPSNADQEAAEAQRQSELAGAADDHRQRTEHATDRAAADQQAKNAEREAQAAQPVDQDDADQN